MEKILARAIFVMLPALFVGTVVYGIFDTPTGAIVTAAFMIGFGLDMTKAVPNRGEI